MSANLASELVRLPSGAHPSPLSGFEHVRGYGVFAMPFSSGHVLALRVFPESDFGPYVSVWHRAPDGAWSIHVDGVAPLLGCPRYFGPATRQFGSARIHVDWTGPMEFVLEMDSPRLRWEVALKEPPVLKLLNPISARITERLWRRQPMPRLMEWMARAVLGMGSVSLAGAAPSGHLALLMPQRMLFVRAARAVLDGLDLGQPATHHPNPAIGGVRLPGRPTFAVGRAYFRSSTRTRRDSTQEPLEV